MTKTLTIKESGIEISFSDLDNENELKIKVKDLDDKKTTIWVSSESLISIKKHLDYIISKF